VPLGHRLQSVGLYRSPHPTWLQQSSLLLVAAEDKETVVIVEKRVIFAQSVQAGFRANVSARSGKPEGSETLVHVTFSDLPSLGYVTLKP